MTTHFDSIDSMREKVGEHLGYSSWRDVSQRQVDQFADATDDHQWIHVDPERAARESPYGKTIAHGYLTLSLAPSLLDEVYTVGGVSMGINYGCNRVRFPAALPVGGRLRLGATLQDFQEKPDGAQVTLSLKFEVENQERPPCVAEVIYRFYR
jgi:acyl dehydratase